MNILLKLNTYGDFLVIPMTAEALKMIEEAQVARSSYVEELGGSDTLVATDTAPLDLISLTAKGVHPKSYIDQLKAEGEPEAPPEPVEPL